VDKYERDGYHIIANGGNIRVRWQSQLMIKGSIYYLKLSAHINVSSTFDMVEERKCLLAPACPNNLPTWVGPD